MKILTSHSAFSNSVNESVCHTFDLPLNSGEYQVDHHSWGSIVEVFAGENAGKYDIEMEGGAYRFLEA